MLSLKFTVLACSFAIFIFIFSSFVQLLHPTDSEDPTISNMPTDVTQNTDSGVSNAVVTWSEPTVNDNSGEVTLTSSHSSGDTFAIGTTTVTYTAVDPSSNTVTDTFTITINGKDKKGT